MAPFTLVGNPHRYFCVITQTSSTPGSTITHSASLQEALEELLLLSGLQILHLYREEAVPIQALLITAKTWEKYKGL